MAVVGGAAWWYCGVVETKRGRGYMCMGELLRVWSCWDKMVKVCVWGGGDGLGEVR